VWPDLDVRGYSGIKVVRKKAEVSGEDVERFIAGLLDEHAEYVPAEGRPLASGDYAQLDFSGTCEGTVFDERKGVWIEVGPRTYLPGFCDRIVGMSRDETRSFSLTLPAEVKPEGLGGKEASFRVTLCEIKQKRLPELNDEFCRGLGGYAGVADLREAVRRSLLAEAEAREERSVVEQINAYLLERIDVPLPQARLEAETDRLAVRTAARLIAHGVKREEVVEKREELRAAARRQAEKSMRLARIYEEIAKREKISVSAEEVEERLGTIAAGLKRDVAELRGVMEKEGELDALRSEIETEKVAAFLVKNARVKEAKAT